MEAILIFIIPYVKIILQYNPFTNISLGMKAIDL